MVRSPAKPRLDDQQMAQLRQIVLNGVGRSVQRGEAALEYRLPRGAHVQADAKARPVTAESPPVASQGRPARARSLVKKRLQDELDRIAASTKRSISAGVTI